VSGERQRFPPPDGRDAPPELVKKKKLNRLLIDMRILYPTVGFGASRAASGRRLGPAATRLHGRLGDTAETRLYAARQ
jgi:hypothetical protein